MYKVHKKENGGFEISYVQDDKDAQDIPYIPESIYLGNDKRERLLKSLITKLQTPPDKKKFYDIKVLQQALEIAKQME